MTRDGHLQADGDGLNTSSDLVHRRMPLKVRDIQGQT